MTADWSPPSIQTVIGWLVLITVISFGTGGLISFLDTSNYSGKSVENITLVSIPHTGAEKIFIALEMEQGSINLSAGSHGEFIHGILKSRYSREGPRQSYSCAGKTGVLTIRQEPSMFYEVINKEDDWNLTINPVIPADISMNCGVGDLMVDAGSLNLTSLQIESGTGDVLIDLSSFTGKHLPVSVNAGIGSVKILLPPDCSVAAEIENGLGTRSVTGLKGSDGRYFCTSGLPASPVISLSVNQGVGDLTLARGSAA